MKQFLLGCASAPGRTRTFDLSVSAKGLLKEGIPLKIGFNSRALYLYPQSWH